MAFDFCRNEKGREYVDTDGFFAKCGAVGKALGLAWGGDWKSFVDKPHLELPKYLPNNSTATLKKQYGTPEAFKKTWGVAGGATSNNENTSASTSTQNRPTIKRGSTGDAVRTLQTILNQSGRVIPLVIDGDFGAKTEKALTEFQAANHLSVDGVCGSKTWAALDAVVAKQPTTSTTAQKSLDDIAREIIGGKWGNGQERKDRLTAAGYDANAVQARVNALLR